MGNRKNKYGLKGYLTVEASFILPTALFLYIFLVFTAFFLYSRCILAQDCYLLSFRGSIFTGWAEEYGEIIYGYLPVRDKEEINRYIEQRTLRLYEDGKYPAFQKESEEINADELKVIMIIKGKTRIPFWQEKEIKIESQAVTTNPIAIIREVRRTG